MRSFFTIVPCIMVNVMNVSKRMKKIVISFQRMHRFLIITPDIIIL